MRAAGQTKNFALRMRLVPSIFLVANATSLFSIYYQLLLPIDAVREDCVRAN
jgi:hypothetical protein